MWFQKKHANALYIDKRCEKKGFMENQPHFSVEPDVIADFREMPFPDGSFNLVVFDPPHMIRKEVTEGWLYQKYGKLLAASWEDDIGRGFAECWRVLAEKGTLLFKWSEAEGIKMKDLEPFFPTPPVFGSNLGKNNKTLWLVFFKVPK